MSTILVIDDDADLLRVMARALSDAGHTALAAPNGAVALDTVRCRTPAAVVIDLFMPEMDGLETIRALRRSCLDTKILAISGGGLSGRMDLLDMAPRLGADAILRKPFRPAELVEAIETLLAPAGS